MPLNTAQVASLDAAITGYGFPPVYFDFSTNVAVAAVSMVAVEAYIRPKLTSSLPRNVIHGLANVLYWGYAQIGYRDVRVSRFLSGVTNAHATDFQMLLRRGPPLSLRAIKNLGMPEFSGISFISKILAFVDPDRYCVLDQQLARISSGLGGRALDGLAGGQQIRVTNRNQAAYDGWCNECHAISHTYFGGRYRVVDVERGFFHLVQIGHLPLAQVIYLNA